MMISKNFLAYLNFYEYSSLDGTLTSLIPVVPILTKLDCIYKNSELFTNGFDFRLGVVCRVGKWVYLEDVNLGLPETCDQRCSTCTGWSEVECTSCKNGYELDPNNSCLCPEDTHFEPLPLGTSCLKCSTNCKTCKNSIEACSSCHNDFLLNTTSSVCECPSKTHEISSENGNCFLIPIPKNLKL